MATIEGSRWQDHLTPVFDITLQRAEGERATLDVQLTRPVPLRGLDEVNITIVDSDDMVRTDRLPGGPSQEEIDRQVWGPYRFVPGSDGADEAGRSVESGPLKVGRGRPFALERTRPPYWQEGPDVAGRWREQWAGSLLRLELTCLRTGLDPWVVPCSVEQPSVPRVRWI
ncbi:hypothetical protein ACH437_30570 [Streptomyces xinghaiensis]|uniref:hypothetical protein n=1 Tax=Streptomyces xinghaiensis TaxID=1038928 RepID=UPI003797C39F